jgi:IS605 OrfB family transposase
LRLRLPRALEGKYGKYLKLENVVFAYGQREIIAALHHKQAISYRFKRDEKSWRVFASTNLEKATMQSIEGNGAIGIDLNADHVACVETDRFGNPIATKIIPWISYGRKKGQLKAITGDICKTIIEWAEKIKKPIVIEKLDFQKKRDSLKHENKKFARLLSSFSYASFFGFLLRRAYKQGIEVHEVNPAFTSVIGRVNYAQRYGLNVHLAAALCIARRHQQFSESPCSPSGTIPDGKGGQVAFVLPVRNRTKHVWHFWGQVKKKITTALAAHYQAMKNRSLSPPSPTLVTA